MGFIYLYLYPNHPSPTSNYNSCKIYQFILVVIFIRGKISTGVCPSTPYPESQGGGLFSKKNN